MTMPESRPPVAPGEAGARLRAARGGPATRPCRSPTTAGRSPVFLALMVGLWCPFCRRQIAQMGAIEGKLKALGVESARRSWRPPPENARLYFKFRPTRAAARVRPGALDAPRVRRAASRPRRRS